MSTLSLNRCDGAVAGAALVLSLSTYTLWDVRVGSGLSSGVVEGTLVEKASAAPFIFLDWSLDVLTGGYIRQALHGLRALRAPLLSVPVADDPSVRVSAATAAAGGGLLAAPEPGLATLHDLVTRAFEKFADWECLGTREVLEYRPNPSGRAGAPPVKVFGPAAWLTYAEVQHASLEFGWGLRACGLEPQRVGGGGAAFDDAAGASSVLFYENTCAGWLLAALGCFSQSLCVTTVYATLGVGAVVEAVNEGGLRAVLCNRAAAAELAGRAAAEMPTLRLLVVSDDAATPATAAAPLPAAPGLEVLALAEVQRRGRAFAAAAPAAPAAPAPDTVVSLWVGAAAAGVGDDLGVEGTPHCSVPAHAVVLARRWSCTPLAPRAPPRAWSSSTDSCSPRRPGSGRRTATTTRPAGGTGPTR